jgi:hypothetical protein
VLIGRTQDFITQNQHSVVSDPHSAINIQHSAMLRFGERNEKNLTQSIEAPECSGLVFHL